MTLHTTFGFLLYVYAPLLLSIVPPSASCGPICVTGFCTLRDFLHFACHIWFLPLWLLFSQLFLPQPPVCCGSILVLPWIVPNIASYRIRVYPLRMLFSTLFHDSFCASPWVFVPQVSLPLFTFGFLPLVAGVPLSCKFLRFLQIPANSCKNSCKFLHFAVVAGIQLSFSTNLFDIYILIIYLKVLICIFYYLISFPVIKNGNFEILNFFEKMLDLENFSTFFFWKFFFLQSQFYFVFSLIKMYLCENLYKTPKIISKKLYFKQIAGNTGFCRNLSGTPAWWIPSLLCPFNVRCGSISVPVAFAPCDSYSPLAFT